jgi:hypothetical protein
MSQPSDNKAEEKKDASDVTVSSAIAVSVADALTEAAGGERSRQAEVAIALFPRPSESPARAIGQVDAVVATVGCTIEWTLLV